MVIDNPKHMTMHYNQTLKPFRLSHKRILSILALLLLSYQSGGQNFSELTELFYRSFEDGQFIKAKEYGLKAIQKCEDEKKLVDCLEIKNQLTLFYKLTDQLENALQHELTVGNDILKVFQPTDPVYLNHRLRLAEIYELKKENGKAEEILLYQMQFFQENNQAIDSIFYSDLLNTMALFYKNTSDYINALKYQLESFNTCKTIYGNESIECLIPLKNLAPIYESMHQKSDAIQVYESCLELIKNNNSTLYTDNNAQNYFIVVSNSLASLYESRNQYEKAAKIYLQAIDLLKNIGSNPNNIASWLYFLANCYTDSDNYHEAAEVYVELYELCISNIQSEISICDPSFISQLIVKSYCESDSCNKALYFLEQELEQEEWRQNNLNHQASLARSLSRLHKDLNQPTKALKTTLRAEEQLRLFDLTESAEYGYVLIELARNYSALGVESKSHLFEKGAKLILENKKDVHGDHDFRGLELDIYYVDRLFLSELYEQMGELEESISILEELHSQIISQPLESEDNYFIVRKLAHLYLKLDSLDYVETLIDYGLQRCESIFGDNSIVCEELYIWKAKFYTTLNDYESAEEVMTRIKSIHERFYSEDKFDLRINSLKRRIHLGHRQYSAAWPLFKVEYDSIFKFKQDSFGLLAESEKAQIIEKFDFFVDELNSFCWHYHSVEPDAIKFSYDLELKLKGILLKSGINMIDLITESKNEQIQNVFQQWQNAKNELAYQYGEVLNDLNQNTDSLEQEITRLEGEMVRTVSSYNQENTIERVGWENVREMLKTNEVAIEFTSFRLRNDSVWTDSTMYMALLLRKNDPSPKLVKLFNEKDLMDLFNKKEAYPSEELFVKRLYKKTLTELIWHPLEKYLNPGDKIYYAPSGLLHSVAFHALTIGRDSVLSDKYDLQRLTSTASLLEKSKFLNQKPINMVLFGGIDYDTVSTTYDSDYTSIKSITQNFRSYSSSVEEKYWSSLIHTRHEIETISDIAQNTKMDVSLYTGPEASEEQYKLVCSKLSPSIIHIATHGFYLKYIAPTSYNTDIIREEPFSYYSALKDPLNRSGILFAGANKSWLGDTISDFHEDGILTAYEAANIYLPHTQLVTLSACETGLGEVKGHEGVFGLQRAFKAAGVENLMVTLWEVDDIATKEFMIYFYEDWFSGNSLYEAYKNTQEYMKKTEKYHHPYYWAAFALIR